MLKQPRHRSPPSATQPLDRNHDRAVSPGRPRGACRGASCARVGRRSHPAHGFRELQQLSSELRVPRGAQPARPRSRARACTRGAHRNECACAHGAARVRAPRAGAASCSFRYRDACLLLRSSGPLPSLAEHVEPIWLLSDGPDSHGHGDGDEVVGPLCSRLRVRQQASTRVGVRAGEYAWRAPLNLHHSPSRAAIAVPADKDTPSSANHPPPPLPPPPSQ